MNLHYDPIDQKWILKTGASRWSQWDGDPFDREAAERIADAIMAGISGYYPAYRSDGRKVYVSIPED